MEGAGVFSFDRFVLDPGDRLLLCDGRPLDVNSRYLDALILLVREQGRLVSKERFLHEVWRGIPVTDEALTQGIKTLRRHLGDDAGRPRFIETVPKHGYRFIGEVSAIDGNIPGRSSASEGSAWQKALLAAGAGTLGGALAGLAGGVFYGFAGTSRPPGEGAISVLLVLICLTVTVAMIGAAGVAWGIVGARARVGRPSAWDVLGGALGGVVVGAGVKLLGLDALALLFGHAPHGITGAPEGLVLGAAVGLGTWVASRWPDRRGLMLAGLAGAIAGLVVVGLGGRLYGGSLAVLAGDFPGSRLSLDSIGALVGETGFGTVSEAVTAAIEGLLFAAGIVAAMLLAERRG